MQRSHVPGLILATTKLSTISLMTEMVSVTLWSPAGSFITAVRGTLHRVTEKGKLAGLSSGRYQPVSLTSEKCFDK